MSTGITLKNGQINKMRSAYSDAILNNLETCKNSTSLHIHSRGIKTHRSGKYCLPCCCFGGWVGPWDGEQGNSDLGSVCEAYFLGKKNFKQVWQNMRN